MAVLGKLLKNRRAGETRMAWNLPGLQGPDTLTVTSDAFADGAAIPRANAAKRVGGTERSPHLTWNAAPAGTARILLVIEDLDSPTAAPFVHCVALIDPAVTALDTGALSRDGAGPGVRVLRSGMGRGYLGPAPIKGHGPHRYVFQVFALATDVADSGLPPHGNGAARATRSVPLERRWPRAALAAMPGPVLARGRLTGTYER